MSERGSADREPELVVLIVDDDPDIAELLAEVFEHHGARALRARGAAEARELLERARVDVVVTDYAMPREDGLTFLASLRASGRGHDLPVIVMTGYDPCGEIVRAARGHGADFLQKPFALETIVGAVFDANARRARARTA